MSTDDHLAEQSGYLLALAYVSLCFFLNLYALRLAVGDEDA